MKTFSLQSGSNGNSIFVEAGGVRLLFDAGISARQARVRMARRGYDIRHVDALIISHGHLDHIRNAGAFHRLFRFPVYVTERTCRIARRRLGKLHDARHFSPGETLRIGAATLHTIPTPHDAVDSVAFVVEAAGRRLGIFTDLGHPFEALRAALWSVDAAYLESNYDPRMLESGPYPPALRARIRGAGGHLSNHESAHLLFECALRRRAWIALAHLSEQNNSPETAVTAHRNRNGDAVPLVVADRCGPSPLLEL